MNNQAVSGLIPAPHRTAFRVSGADALEALQGQLSQDLSVLAPGTGIAGALLTPQGHLRAEVRVLKSPERWWLDCPRQAGEYLRDALQLGALGRSVTIDEVTDAYQSVILVDADSLIDPPPPREEHSYVKGSYGLLVRSLYGIEAIVAAVRYDGFIASLAPLNLLSVDPRALERRRIMAGRAAVGVDTGSRTLVQEAGLDRRLVSFSKGCYVGQEPVARLHWKGKVNRRLRQVECDAPVHAGMEVLQDSTVRGHITTVATDEHTTIALAMLRRETKSDDHVEIGEERISARITPVVVG